MNTIGFISYSSSPRRLSPPERQRALLAEAALQGAAVTFLDGASCDVDAGVFLGEQWDGGNWRTATVALPDAAVFQEPPFTAEQRRIEAWVRARRPVIADRTIDKLTLATLLGGSRLAAYAIPGAVLSSGCVEETVTAFLREHGSAVVKPVDGQRGLGILFVLAAGDGWAVRQGDVMTQGSLAEAAAVVASRIAGRMRYRSYLIQRFIATAAADGRPADMRVHTQRRADGAWGVTRAYVRLAEAGTLLTNISQGGYQGSLDGFLARRAVRSADAVSAEICAAALAVSQIVDAAQPDPLSELGVDLVLDGDDRLWVLEVNGFPQTSRHEHARAVHTVGYALALAQGMTPPRAAAANRETTGR